jgi:putative Mg2+ transporter-C (MgtC) family protein
MPEPELRRVVTEHGFSIANLTYRLTGEGKHFEYRMVVRTLDPDNLRALSETLNGLPTVLEYRIAPTGD